MTRSIIQKFNGVENESFIIQQRARNNTVMQSKNENI